MPQPAQDAAVPNGKLRFDVYEADPRAGELRKHGYRIRLENRPFRTLLILLRHAHEVVTREELQKQLWPTDVFIDFDNGLNTVVGKIRRALNDSAETPRFVETVGQRGYRFIAAVDVVDPQVPSNVAEPAASLVTGASSQAAPLALDRKSRSFVSTWRFWAAVSVILIALAGSALSLWSRWRSAAQQIHSVAVLPLENLSGDANQEYLADGLTEELITDLARIRSLRVISRTSSMRYRNTQKPLPQVARELNVDAIVEGSVTRSGNHIRITAKLIKANDQSVWADSYEGTLADVLSLRADVARSIVREIRLDLAPGEQQSLTAKKIADPAAYDAYLLGRYYWEKRTKEGLLKSVEQYNKAIDLDPNYAPAYSGLASSYHIIQTYGFMPASEKAAEKSKAAAQKALSIDQTVGDAYAVLADNFTTYDWNWIEAERMYKRALEFGPNDSNTLQWYAEYLNAMGRPAEAIAEIEKARAVDPASLVVGAVAGRVFYIARQYDRAIEQCKKTIEMDPNFARSYVYLARVYEQKEMYPEALAAYEKARSLAGRSTGTPALQPASKRLDAGDYWRQRLEWANRDAKEGRPSTFDLAVIYAHTSKRDNDKAFAFLEKAYDEHSAWMAELKVAPLFDPLRSDPRFTDLVRRVGLP